MTQDRTRLEIDTTVPHSARIWDYWLGGKDHYEADKRVGRQIAEAYPEIVETARAQRAFLCRGVRWLAGEAGIRQFLDVGTGLPTVDNTHEIAQRVAPDSRIVYVDHDPLVLAHARALLTSTGEGVTDYVDADLREPDAILAAATSTLDFDRPVALLLLGITAHITDDDTAYAITDHLLAALAPGSYLMLCDGTEVFNPEGRRELVRQWNSAGDNPRVNRSPEQLRRFFAGLELIEPGLVPITQWRPEAMPFGEPDVIDNFGAIGRKPDPA